MPQTSVRIGIALLSLLLIIGGNAEGAFAASSSSYTLIEGGEGGSLSSPSFQLSASRVPFVSAPTPPQEPGVAQSAVSNRRRRDAQQAASSPSPAPPLTFTPAVTPALPSLFAPGTGVGRIAPVAPMAPPSRRIRQENRARSPFRLRQSSSLSPKSASTTPLKAVRAKGSPAARAPLKLGGATSVEASAPTLRFFAAVDAACPSFTAAPAVAGPAAALAGGGFGLRDRLYAATRSGVAWARSESGRGSPISRHLSLLFVALAAMGGAACGVIVSQGRRHRRLGRVLRMQRVHSLPWLVLVVGSVLILLFLLAPEAGAAQTVPSRHTYNGYLLGSNGSPITSPVNIRFSYWSSTDHVSGDTTASGAINVNAGNYLGWQEVHTVTPNGGGSFSVVLGSITPLPDLSLVPTWKLLSLHMQIEVKPSGSPDTSYELLDVNPADSNVDRSPVLSTPFARNADLLDQREPGTGSGSIPVLGSGGSLTLTGDRLQFGGSLAKVLSFDKANDRFNFNDDLRIQGDLTVTGRINGAAMGSLAPLNVSASGGLSIGIASGSYRLNGTVTAYPGGGANVPNNALNYIFFGSGGLAIRTLPFPGDESHIPLAQVTTSNGVITSVTDKRILQSDDRERTVEQTFHPEFANASYQADGTANVGQLAVTHDNLAQRNFYLWTSTRPQLQDYDVLLRVTLPEEFVRWEENPLSLTYRTTSPGSGDSTLNLSVYDTNGQPVTLSGAALGLVSTSWATTQIEFVGNPMWTPGQDLLLRLKLSAKGNFQVHLSSLQLRYREFTAH